MSDAWLRAEGSRADLIARLHGLAEGSRHLGNDRRAAYARAAAERLKAGDSSIRVGATIYVVTGE